jgi:hypothetical protein
MIPIFNAVANWWRDWRAVRANLASLDRCGAEDTDRIAQDLGITATDLRALAGKWPDSTELLDRRLAALELDRTEIQRQEPQVLSDLRRVCTMCKSGRECRHDLAENPYDPGWREYCPNVVTLDALSADRAKWARRRRAIAMSDRPWQ